jgi:curved DNA-binding protein CbpA
MDAALSALDRMDYFQILKLSRTATPAEVKRAFHQGSRAFHPDRYYGLADQSLRDKINFVYKRMTEAYYVLREDVSRTQYIADIDGPERAKKLRFTAAEEVQTKVSLRKEQEEQIGSTPKGRQFYKSGMADFEARRWSAAERNFKMALTYEPANVRYKEKLSEAQQRLNQ